MPPGYIGPRQSEQAKEFPLRRRRTILLIAVGLIAWLATSALLVISVVERRTAVREPTRLPRTSFIVGPMARGLGPPRELSEVWGILLHSTQGVPRGDMRVLSRSSKISVHFLVLPNGEIHQLVRLARVAYHAGRGELDGHRGNLNRGLVGIEVSNPSKPGHDVAYPSVQLRAVDRVISIIDQRLGRRVPIFGHKDVIRYPGGWRKTDPEGDFPLRAYKKYRQHNRPESD